MRWIVLMMVHVLAFGNEIASYQPYDGSVRLEFLTLDEEFYVEMETDSLILRSVSWEDYKDYVSFFQGSEESLVEALKVWTWRWEEGCDPYSALSVFKKEDEEEIFIGYVVLDHGLERGCAELKIAIDCTQCEVESVKQAVLSVLQEYATCLHTLNFYVNLNDSKVAAAPLQHIHAIASVDDWILDSAFISSGLFHYDEEIVGGIFLKHYIAPITHLQALCDQRE